MSRNGSGTYTLPSGNPVVSGTLIEASWANSTLSDIASALTDSLSRSGQGGMTAALRLFDGTSSVPGLAWGSETTTGWYRAGAGDMRLVVTGSEIMRYQATGVGITGTLSASGNTSVGGTLSATGAATFNSTTQTNGLATFGGRIYLAASAGPTWDTNTYLWAESGFGARYDSFNHRFDVGLTRTLGMVLNSSGNLGIGTSSPTSRLTIGSGSFASAASETTGMYTNGSNGLVILTDAVGINTRTGGQLLALTNAGNLGLGVTPSAWSSSFKALNIGANGQSVSADGGQIIIGSNYVQESGGARYVASAAAGSYSISRNSHAWYVAPSGTAGNAISFTQAMTLDASGNLLVGTTADTSTNATGATFAAATNGRRILRLGATTTSSSNVAEFYNTSGNVGAIVISGATTNFATSSDYRLKKDVQPMTGALAKVAALKPCTYKWKADGSDGEGFIAHELAEVCPHAVTGEKDGIRIEQYEITPAVFEDVVIPAVTDEDGRITQPECTERRLVSEAVMGEREVPAYQGIDASFLVATLTAAIQELKAEFDAYKASHP